MPYRTPILTPDWMRVAEAAARLDVHPKTVYKKIQSGGMPVRTHRFGRTLRLNRLEFEAYAGSRPVAKTT